MPTLANPGDEPQWHGSHGPGDHVVVFGDGPSSMDWRRAGWQVRDTILVAFPGNRYVPAILLRRPVDGTVLDTLLTDNVGCLNIDAVRVNSGRKQATAGRRTIRWGVGHGGSSYEKGTGAVYSSEGRWPTNLLVVHTRRCYAGYCAPGCPAPLLDDSRDVGGASRFFAYCTSTKGALVWLKALLGSV